MECPKCKSKDVDVNGIFYRCNSCGQIDDSTFSMITEPSQFRREK